jgi:hypothetical protein
MSVGCLFLFDVSNLESFNALKRWFLNNAGRHRVFADENELNAQVFTAIGIAGNSMARVIEFEEVS